MKYTSSLLKIVVLFLSIAPALLSQGRWLAPSDREIRRETNHLSASGRQLAELH